MVADWLQNGCKYSKCFESVSGTLYMFPVPASFAMRFCIFFFLSWEIFANIVKIEITEISVHKNSFPITILDKHNYYRRLHFAQDLVWNNSLFEYASDFVSQYDCSGILAHSGGPYGENIAIGYSTIGAVSAWYNEGKDYKYGSDKVYNHFTALIWNTTSELGCALKECGDVWGKYIVCSYYPPGNVVGQSPYNVFPPSPQL